MGLDTVELVMAWEEAFDVRIPDDVAAGLMTPRHTVDWLCTQLPLREAPLPFAAVVLRTATSLRGDGLDDSFIDDLRMD